MDLFDYWTKSVDHLTIVHDISDREYSLYSERTMNDGERNQRLIELDSIGASEEELESCKSMLRTLRRWEKR